MREFQYDAWLANIQKHRITHIQTAPPILVMLAKRPETNRYDLSSLVNILCGAAPLSKELQNEVSDKLDLKIVQTWGMTEVRNWRMQAFANSKTCAKLALFELLGDLLLPARTWRLG